MTVTTYSFTTPGTMTAWTVPFHTAGSMTVKVVGGGGGGSPGHAGGGSGGRLAGNITLAPGTVVTVIVGAAGGNGYNAPGGARLGGAGGGPAGWIGAVGCMEGHGGHGTFTVTDCLFPAPTVSKYSSIGAYVHPHIATTWERVALCGWSRYALYLNGSPSGAGSHHSLIDVTATDCSLIQGAKGSTVHLVRCVEQGTPSNGGSYMMGTVISHGSTWRLAGMVGTQNDDIDFTFCGDHVGTPKWWLGPGRNTTGTIRIIGCHVELSAQTRVVGAADSSPLDVTVVASEFVGSTTRQAFNVPAGTVRFVDCEAP